MWKLPFIARSTYEDACRSHEYLMTFHQEQIELLRELLAKERARFDDREKQLNDHILELMKPAPIPEPVDLRKRWAKREQEEREEFPAQPLDLTQIDENDQDALAFLVSREVPAGTKVNGVTFMQSMKKLRDQILSAKRERLNGYSTPGIIPVPASVMQQIEEAEAAGRQEALKARA